MQVSVRFFASLRELIGSPSLSMNVEEKTTVNQLWESILSERRIKFEGVMMTVNHEYVKADHLLKSGDEVGFFPPVTGG